MMKKPVTTKAPAEQVVKDIRRATRKLHSSEEKIRIVLSGLRGEDSIAELCRKEGIAQSLYYSWSKEFLEAGKKRLAAASPVLISISRCASRSVPRASRFFALRVDFDAIGIPLLFKDLSSAAERREPGSDSRVPSLPLRSAMRPLRGDTRIFFFIRNINVFVD